MEQMRGLRSPDSKTWQGRQRRDVGRDGLVSGERRGAGQMIRRRRVAALGCRQSRDAASS
ncbi:hypothetical protein BWI15_07290 [Kribbella sp. ALI-6-A]|nr:hypothetical protein BWI15_07290 [Kribbella sp. ALI-6-A]